MGIKDLPDISDQLVKARVVIGEFADGVSDQIYADAADKSEFADALFDTWLREQRTKAKAKVRKAQYERSKVSVS